jgi:sphingomyelin phosphodiesterase acid-like 3
MIEAAFCGHTHMDEFRILHDSGKRPLVYMHVTPSVSPVFGNNPAYQIFSLDPAGQALADYFTRMLNLAASLDAGTAGWETEYRFSKAYDQTALTPEILAAVRKAMPMT